jgi:hypothetical protein
MAANCEQQSRHDLAVAVRPENLGFFINLHTPPHESGEHLERVAPGLREHKTKQRMLHHPMNLFEPPYFKAGKATHTTSRGSPGWVRGLSLEVRLCSPSSPRAAVTEEARARAVDDVVAGVADRRTHAAAALGVLPGHRRTALFPAPQCAERTEGAKGAKCTRCSSPCRVLPRHRGIF